MSKTIQLEMPTPKDISRLRLPSGVQSRLDELLDRQDKGIKLTVRERREAEGWSRWLNGSLY